MEDLVMVEFMEHMVKRADRDNLVLMRIRDHPAVEQPSPIKVFLLAPYGSAALDEWAAHCRAHPRLGRSWDIFPAKTTDH